MNLLDLFVTFSLIAMGQIYGMFSADQEEKCR
jgi:hypothetical protein